MVVFSNIRGRQRRPIGFSKNFKPDRILRPMCLSMHLKIQITLIGLLYFLFKVPVVKGETVYPDGTITVKRPDLINLKKFFAHYYSLKVFNFEAIIHLTHHS